MTAEPGPLDHIREIYRGEEVFLEVIECSTSGQNKLSDEAGTKGKR